MIPNINLLPQIERQNIVLYRIFIIGLIVVLLAFIGLTYTFFHTKGNISKIAEQNEQLTEQRALLEVQLANVGSHQPESLESAVHFAKEQVVPTSMLIEEFNNLLPNHAYLTTYEYMFRTVEIESQFESKSDISTYIISLLGSGYMRDVRVDQIETNELDTIDHEHSLIRSQKVRYSFDINLAKLKEEAKQHE